ncbi:MAG: hypothetical protein H8E86_05560, partial [Planctomycetes bacterium]|nr:hypothetical protein [Planctomycetota bacterium]
ATTVSVNYAIDANRQLVRNEKLLEFAEETLHIQHYIVIQQEKYWQTHLGIAQQTADKLSEGDRKLQLEMYRLLGMADMSSNYDAKMFQVAWNIAVDEYGNNSPEALILETQIAVKRMDSDREGLPKKLHELSKRWQGGTPKQHAEFLRLIAFGQLASSDTLTREEGNANTREAILISQKHLGPEETVSLLSRQVWSNVFIDGSITALDASIELYESKIKPLIDSEYAPSEWASLRRQILIAVVYLSRGQAGSGVQRVDDIDTAIAMNEYIVETLIEKTGDGYNSVWQVMNNLAICYALKADILEERGDVTQATELKKQGAAIWLRIFQQVYFKLEDDDLVRGWYSASFRHYLPELAPSDEDLDAWLLQVGNLPKRTQK